MRRSKCEARRQRARGARFSIAQTPKTIIFRELRLMPKDDADGFGGLLLRARPRFSSEAMVPGTTATSLLG